MRKIKSKKIVFRLILLLVVVIVIELISIPVFYYLNDNSLSKKQLHDYFLSLKKNNENIEISPFDFTSEIVRDDVLHPYLGFVKDSDIEQIHYNNEFFVPINTYGFLGDFPKDPSSYKIAIFGGSVAQELFLYSKNTLIEELQRSPVFNGKKIEIASIAISGMKQPQQLMALNYFLSIGKFFDIVINLDGFNELVLPPCENVVYKVAPSYPRSYRAYTSKSFSKKMLYLISEVIRSKVNRIEYGTYFLSSPLRYSHFALSLYLVLSKMEYNKQLEFDKEVKNELVNRTLKNKISAQERGPDYAFSKPDEVITYSSGIWYRTSVIMQQICKGNNFKYFHFLQPNQYVKGSKVLTDWERNNAFADKDYCYRQVVEFGYPSLIEHGKNLKRQGLNFHDLTGIFKDVPSDIYKDDCCHYNQVGNDILAKKIAEIVTSTPAITE